MPSLDLIRHGKNAAAHRHLPHRVDPPLPPPPSAAPEPVVPADNTASRGLRYRDHPSPPMDVVESIVNEERRVKDRMPTYRGLEGYSLELKMGE